MTGETETAERDGSGETTDESLADARSVPLSNHLAALDIGTNSFHLVVARFFGDDHRFEVVTREKEMVRLGSGDGDMKNLEAAAIDRGIAALGRMRQIAEIHHAPLYAVATSAVREADNAKEFLRRARVEAGVDVEVVSGLEEARLIYLGVLQAVPVFDEQTVLIDIGGGSTEILVGLRGETLECGSLKLGCIRLTRRFFKSEVLHPSAIDACRRHVRAALAPMARAVKKQGFAVAVGSSGTIGAVASLIHRLREPDLTEPRTFNSFEFTRKEVRAVVRLLADAETVEERRQIKGMDERRADIILAGAVILDETMNELGIATMMLSDFALREGVLLDAHERESGGSLHHLRDLRRKSVVHLADVWDDDPAHSAHVAELALQLFDQTAKTHGFGDDARELLEAAALLANVGQSVSHDKHHKHSYYVIRNTDQLPGFTDHEIELIALIARYHRKSAPKDSHEEFGSLSADDQRMVTTLAGLLRVGIGLDRTHSGAVSSVDVSREGKGDDRHFVVTAVAQPGADVALELYTANDRKDLLEQVLGHPVEIVSANGPAAI